ncbi:MAG: hypothetical protein JSW25_07405 [Thermoplasmata archaeon]|nr:MAG: hypothetical protein JSW25_07405 [Thermoplasmata archaeon]
MEVPFLIHRHSRFYEEGLLTSALGIGMVFTTFALEYLIIGELGVISVGGLFIAVFCALVALDSFRLYFRTRQCPYCKTPVRVDLFECPDCGTRYVGDP